MEPKILAKFSERPRLAEVGDTVYAFHVTAGPKQEVAVRRSHDSARSWNDPEVTLSLTDDARWGGPEVLADNDGGLHLFLVNDNGTGVFYPRDFPNRPPALPMTPPPLTAT